MKTEWRRFAPLGLVIAGLAAVSAFALFVLYRNVRGLPFLISVGLVVVGLALFALLDPERVRRAITGRQARYGSNALIRSVAFVGIVVIVNILVFQLASLYPDRTKVDLTEGKQNSLAEQTLDTLAKLPESVKAVGFYSPQAAGAQENADAILRRYAENSKGKFTYEFLNPDANPLAVKNAGIPAGKDGMISIEMGDKRQLVDFADEERLTSALVKLMSTEARTLYFLTGHGEHNPEDSGDTAYASAKRLLTNKNYTVKLLNLRTDTAIPEDAQAIIIAGPTKPVSPEEINLIIPFVAAGGKLIVLQDPRIQTDFGDAADPLADYLIGTWGITLGNDFIVQVATNQPSPYITGIEMATHPIISQGLQNNPPLFIAAQSVRTSADMPTVTLTEIVKSTSFYENCYPSCAWASTNPDDISAWLSGTADGPANPTTDDLLGPVTIVASGEMSAMGSRVVVFGDSDFASDAFFDAYGNSDLFINAIDWAVGQEDLIALTPKSTTPRTLNISAENLAVVNNALFLGLVIGLPALVILAGAVNWFIRRSRG
jgi:hypothetical protein